MRAARVAAPLQRGQLSPPIDEPHLAKPKEKVWQSQHVMKIRVELSRATITFCKSSTIVCVFSSSSPLFSSSFREAKKRCVCPWLLTQEIRLMNDSRRFFNPSSLLTTCSNVLSCRDAKCGLVCAGILSLESRRVGSEHWRFLPSL